MEKIFIATPVSVETLGDARDPDGQEPAITIRDRAGQDAVRIPTPGAPRGRPHLEALALACAQDIARQINEAHAALCAAVGEAGLSGALTVGVTATRRSERVIGDWHYTLILPSGQRLMAPVDPLSYDSDAPRTADLVRRAVRSLARPRPGARR